MPILSNAAAGLPLTTPLAPFGAWHAAEHRDTLAIPPSYGGTCTWHLGTRISQGEFGDAATLRERNVFL